MMNIQELKAKGYDLLAAIQSLQNELNQTNQLIIEAAKIASAEVIKEDEKKK